MFFYHYERIFFIIILRDNISLAGTKPGTCRGAVPEPARGHPTKSPRPALGIRVQRNLRREGPHRGAGPHILQRHRVPSTGPLLRQARLRVS